MIAAQAAYAASLQGQVLEMHDLLYQNQLDWAKSNVPRLLFDGYAAKLGLDLAALHADIDAQATTATITKQRAEAVAAGVNYTPRLMVNGVEVRPQKSEDLEALIQDGLE